jgi:hypothetical protein
MLVDLAEVGYFSEVFIVIKTKPYYEMGWNNEANKVCEVANLQIYLHFHMKSDCKLQRGWFLFQKFRPNGLD